MRSCESIDDRGQEPGKFLENSFALEATGAREIGNVRTERCVDVSGLKRFVLADTNP